ncbi:unnamed protein product [Strongylus vulgaris]|uniref:Uncharacterized protein n=1 Tax=Strongylus vulgaris TaxID=40348 RepID=A0A3P7I1U8_STRVU|nr:unnamed protein product [Strongylus vulgaris]
MHFRTNDLELELDDDFCSSDSSPLVSPSLRTPAIALPPPPPKSAPPFSQAAQFTNSASICNGDVSLSNGGTPTTLHPDDSLLRPRDLETNGKRVEIQSCYACAPALLFGLLRYEQTVQECVQKTTSELLSAIRDN